MIKKIVVFLANSAMSLFLLLAVMSAVLLAVFNATNIKQWLSEGKVYDNIVGALLEQAETAVQEDVEAGKTNPLKDPGVQAAAQKALSPEFLRSNTEEVVDGVSAWLDGKTPQPVFAIELSDVKKTFAANVGTYATERYAALPDCAPGQVPGSTDVLQVTCKVPGYNPEADIQKAVSELQNSPDFLPDETITPEDIKAFGDAQGSEQQPLFQKLEGLPQLNQAIQFVPLVFGLLTVASALTVLFASETKRRGVKTIASTIVPVGLVLFLEAWLVSIGIDRLTESVANSSDAGQSLRQVFVNIVHGLGDDLWRSVMTFAVVVTLSGLALIVGLVLTRPKHDPMPPVEPQEPPAGPQPTDEHQAQASKVDEPAAVNDQSSAHHQKHKKVEG